MLTLLPFLSLFISTFFLQLGLGSIAPVDALAGAAKGFSTLTLGFLGTAHFLGFGMGCFLSPIIISRVGHSRTFAIAAAIATVGALSHPLFPIPWVWLILRVLSGISIAMAYSVVESWFHARATNQVRGRIFSLYRISDMCGGMFAQFFIVMFDPSGYIVYNVIAILCCIALLPLAATAQQAPQIPETLRLRPLKVWKISPLAVCGVFVAGVTTSCFRMVTPIFGIELSLTADQISLLLVLTILAGVSAQYPIGWLSDRFSRRTMLLLCSILAMISCMFLMMNLEENGSTGLNLSVLYIGFVLFGLSTFPIYSISAAHANDFAPVEMSVELSAGLIFYYAVGAVLSPAISSYLMEIFEPALMFVHISAIHALFIAYILWRMTRRTALTYPGRKEGFGYRYLPRTSFLQGLLLQNRDKPKHYEQENKSNQAQEKQKTQT